MAQVGGQVAGNGRRSKAPIASFCRSGPVPGNPASDRRKSFHFATAFPSKKKKPFRSWTTVSSKLVRLELGRSDEDPAEWKSWMEVQVGRGF
jgi:hypothetical protein